MPVPAIRKLLAFQWLMKHTEHYDAKLMGQENFLMYMTKFLTTERKIASRKGNKQRLLECDELYKQYLKVTGHDVVLEYGFQVQLSSKVCILPSNEAVLFDTTVENVPELQSCYLNFFSLTPIKFTNPPLQRICHTIRVPRTSVVHMLREVTAARNAIEVCREHVVSATLASLQVQAAQTGLQCLSNMSLPTSVNSFLMGVSL